MPVEGYAITITLHGDEAVVETVPIEGNDIDYETLNSAVDGYIERVPLMVPTVGEMPGFSFDLWVNEEGLLKELPMNLLASGLAQVLSRRDYILVGNVILTGTDDTGETTPPLSQEQAQVLGQLLLMVVGRLS